MTSQTPHDIAASIRPALTQLYVLYFRLAGQSDLTGPQMTILTRLDEHGPARISQIAQAEGIRMPTASNALHQLEQRGMIERIRDEEDRRGVKVRLTEFGHSELKRVGEERTAHLARMLESLPAEKLAETARLAPVINDLAETYSDILKQQ
ncbi:MarR family winged helix-turn-helix transcriptional regulator [Corynebacterium vitaeruminis]|uniref:MarR family transcriptional regulator n=1 Tax=Corynebacterium vitaeruminis DSM 20294 TaxID=1224164 RepID=W5Y4S7_9CORY|nr:MarR family transcriptional regulator [Corynebacterium vitaeruminis]AHI23889.1 MarR family transcriptional regulator [Corynebacterium vitaeruminis DSM 20294]